MKQLGMGDAAGDGEQMSAEEYERSKPDELRKDIRMISGCQDKQTSADVGNVAAFQLPDPAGVCPPRVPSMQVARRLSSRAPLPLRDSSQAAREAVSELRARRPPASMLSTCSRCRDRSSPDRPAACTSTLLKVLYADEQVPETDLRCVLRRGGAARAPRLRLAERAAHPATVLLPASPKCCRE